MRRIIGLLAGFSLLVGFLWAAKPKEEQSSRFEPIQVLATTEPTYPATSIAEGTVILQVTVGEWGKIDAVKVLHEVPSLTGEAVRTVRKWKFKSAALDGKPVTSTMVAAFYFGRPVISRR